MKIRGLAFPLAAAVALGGCAQSQAAGGAATAAPAQGGGAEITMGSGTFQASGAGLSVKENVLTITAGGTYTLSGTLDDGQIVVDAEDKDVELVLNGANLTSGTGAPLYAKGGKVTVTLADGTENSLADAADYRLADGEDEPSGALFSKDDLTIGGTGALAVTGNYKHAIAGKDDLVINGGTLYVKAASDGIRGRDSIVLNGGTVTVEAGKDGLQSNNDQDADKGTVTLNGGSLRVTAGNDAVQAETALSVTGGEYTLTTGGGSGSGHYQGEDSCKGLKAGGDLAVTGGTFLLDTLDDAVHANGAAGISGGTFTISTGDDGIHADGALTVSGGDITILKSYEGLEGLSVTVADGSIHVTASDDGINAADASVQEGPGFGGGQGGMAPPEGMTRPDDAVPPEGMEPPGGAEAPEKGASAGGSAASASGEAESAAASPGGGRPQRAEGMGGRTLNGNVFIRISGGTVAVDAEGDALDSNGMLYLEGGTVLLNGPTNSGNGALDSEGGCTVTGGILAAAGSAGMAQSPGNASAQASLTVYFSEKQAAGTAVSLSAMDGASILTFIPTKEFQTVVFSTPDLKEGETVVLSTGGEGTADEDGYAAEWSGGTKLAEITLEKVTRVSEDGSAVTGGMGGAAHKNSRTGASA